MYKKEIKGNSIRHTTTILFVIFLIFKWISKTKSIFKRMAYHLIKGLFKETKFKLYLTRMKEMDLKTLKKPEQWSASP